MPREHRQPGGPDQLRLVQDRGRCARVHLAAAPEGELLVGDLAVDLAAEPEVIALAVQELAQRAAEVRSRPAGGRGEQLDREPGAQDRRLAQLLPAGAVELVDPDAHGLLDRGRQLAGEAGGGQLDEELRAALGAADQRIDLDGPEPSTRHGGHQGPGLGVRERAEADRVVGRRQAAADLSAREQHRPAVPVDLGQQRADHLGRDRVHPLRAVQHHQPAAGEQRDQQTRHAVPQPRQPEPVVEVAGLGRAGRLGADGGGQQRQPGQQVGQLLLDVRREDGAGPRPVVAFGEPEQRAEQLLESPVGDRRAVGVGDHLGDREPCLDSDLLGQPALAHPGLRGDLVQRGRCRPVPQHPERGGPAHERDVGRVRPRTVDAADHAHLLRLGLPLDRDRLVLGDVEEHPGRAEQRGVGEHSACRRPAAEPGGEVGAVAHRGEGAAGCRAHRAGERRHGGARADRQRPVVRRDVEQHAEQPATGVLDRARCSRGEEVAVAVAREVGVQQRHLVAAAGVLDPGGELLDCCQRRAPGEQRTEPGDSREAERHPAVVGLRAEQIAPFDERGGEIAPQVGTSARGCAPADRRHRWHPTQQHSRAGGGTESARRQLTSGLLAEQDLPGRGLVLEHDQPVQRRAAHDHVLLVAAGEQEVELAAVHADRHPQPGPSPRQVHVPGHPEQLLDRLGRVRRVGRVLRPVVEDQQRVAGELHDVTAVVGGRHQQREDPAQRRHQVLGADPAAPAELLGQGREPRDVQVGHRPVDPPLPRRVGRPLGEQPWHERRGLRPALHLRCLPRLALAWSHRRLGRAVDGAHD